MAYHNNQWPSRDQGNQRVWENERVSPTLELQVRWVGYAEEWDTYEPIAVLGSATQRINEYKRSLPVEVR